jgi:PAS domain S-box-containing protein
LVDLSRNEQPRAESAEEASVPVARPRLNESLYRPLVEYALPDALFVHDFEGRFIDVNQHACDSLGYTKSELLTMGVKDVERDFDLAAAKMEWKRLRPGRTLVLFGRQQHKDGSCFPVEIHCGCHDESGVRFYIAIVRDITRRKQAEEALLRSEERFRKIFRNTSIGIAIADWSGRFQRCNPAFCRLLGYSEEELRTIAFSSLIHPEDRDTNLAEIQRLKSGELPHFQIENRYVRKNGLAVWTHKFVSALPGENGEPAHLMALVNDITDGKKAEITLAEREAQYRAVIETAADGFWMLDETGRILATNEAYARRSGYSQGELLGMSIAKLEAQESPGEVKDHVARVRQNGSDLFETWHVTKHGERWPVEVNTSFWPAAGGRLFAFLRDITERRQAAIALQESEARFRATFEQAAVGIAHVSTEGRWLRVNQKLCEILGYSSEELISHEFRIITHPEDIEGDLDLLQRMLAGEMSTLALEKRYVHKSGSIVWTKLTSALLRTASGAPDYFITVIEDISERKQTEAALHALYAEMEQLTHFQIANQTAAAFAHELNQPLNAVASYSEAALRLLRAGNPRPERLIHAIESSAQQAQRAGRVVREFVAFMAEKEVQTEPNDLNDIVRHVLARVEKDGFDTARIHVDLEPELRPVMANRLQVEKVLINLVENSIEAMRDAGVDAQAIAVTVRTSADAAMAQVTVTDKGPGIDRETLRRIFDPFFTTKPKGLGMGLAISRTIIEAHGGQLWVETDPGAGATFHFTLPFADLARSAE